MVGLAMAEPVDLVALAEQHTELFRAALVAYERLPWWRAFARARLLREAARHRDAANVFLRAYQRRYR
jgi:hypothetical protein